MRIPSEAIHADQSGEMWLVEAAHPVRKAWKVEAATREQAIDIVEKSGEWPYPTARLLCAHLSPQEVTDESTN